MKWLALAGLPRVLAESDADPVAAPPIKISEFEQRQLKAIRGELDAQFTTRNAPVTSAAIPQPQPVYPATTGLDPAALPRRDQSADRIASAKRRWR